VWKGKNPAFNLFSFPIIYKRDTETRPSNFKWIPDPMWTTIYQSQLQPPIEEEGYVLRFGQWTLLLKSVNRETGKKLCSDLQCTVNGYTIHERNECDEEDSEYHSIWKETSKFVSAINGLFGNINQISQESFKNLFMNRKNEDMYNVLVNSLLTSTATKYMYI
jgi:hypothetical protein